MRVDFEQRLLDAIEQDALLAGGGRVLAAVSGGADSVALVCGLVGLRQELGIEVVIGHINHQLRGRDSEQDEIFVKDLAGRLGIEAYFAKAAVSSEAQRSGESIETTGRQVRLATLARMAGRSSCGCVATGHQMDDQAETVLFRLLRGTGFRGLCGIRPEQEFGGIKFIRPMLQIRRREIQQYCRLAGILWREDDSNSDVRFRRNWIRHRLLSYLQSQSTTDITEALSNLSRKACAMDEKIEQYAQKLWTQALLEQEPGRTVLCAAGIAEAVEPVAAAVIRRGIEGAGCGLRYVNRGHYQRLIELVKNGRGCVSLPGGFEAAVSGEKIIFARAQPERPTDFPQNELELEIGREIRFGPWRIAGRLLRQGQWDLERFVACKDSFVEWFDADEIFGPVVARSRRQGDRFQPIGMGAEKKVGKFLTDAGVEPELKDKVFVIADSDRILWICPVRRSAQAGVSERTRRVLEIRILPV